jgi:DNA/RNA-binding domain of Phe-tRNA-synthetase-like protein
MQEIIISHAVKTLLPELVLGCIACDIVMAEGKSELWSQIETVSSTFKESVELAAVGNHPAIKASRMAYRLCGKDPARYRLSSEALMRRAVKGYPLYHINNVVDLVNLISLESGMSIGGYDAEKVSGNVIFDIGRKDEPYEAIGRGEMNIEFLPVFRDLISAFGSPTSDSVRTSVTAGTRRFLMIVVGFSGEADTRQTVEQSIDLLKKYADAQNFETIFVR